MNAFFSNLQRRIASLGTKLAGFAVLLFFVLLAVYGGYLAYAYLIQPLPPLPQQAPPPTLKQDLIDRALTPETSPLLPRDLTSPFDPPPSGIPASEDGSPRPQG